MPDQEYLELNRILIDFPLPYVAVKELHILETANYHSIMNLRLISKKQLTKTEVLRYTDLPITVYTPEGGCIYAGICTELSLYSLNQYMEIGITAKSFSYQSDIKAENRTFQNPSKHLREVVDRVLGSYGYAIDLQKDIAIPIMLSQEGETDWAFVRRVANQFGYTVFVDSKSKGKRISIGTVPFSQETLNMGELPTLSKDIHAFWCAKNNTAPGASAYEFLQQGCQTALLTLGVGHAISGGVSPQILVKSEITAQGGLLVNAVMAAYQDGAYPPSPNTAGKVATGGSLGSGNPKSAGGGGKQSVSSVVSGTVLDVAGTEVQVAFRDGTAGGVRWIPYCSVFSNDFYCMPDIGDTVYCYYETDGAVVCMGSRHVNTDSPDFGKPEEKVLTANNCMIRQKPDGIEMTANRKEMDGEGGERVKITFSDTDGVDIASSKEITIRAENNILLQSNDLETVKENLTEWFDSERKTKMEQFDKDQSAGAAKYVADGGNTSYNAGWDLTKNLASHMWEGFVGEITSPFQIVSTIGSMLSPGGDQEAPPEPVVKFEKIDEHQVMIIGLESCILQTQKSSVRFSGETVVFQGPDFWALGLKRSSDYEVVSESQKSFMDTIMDVVQTGIDLIGLIPGCNIVCGAINAGISLLRGDYYGALSSVAGMFCPGGGLVLHTLNKIDKVSDGVKKTVKALTILKMGATGLNAALLCAPDAKELWDKIRSGDFHFDNQEDLELLNSVGRNFATCAQSVKGLKRELGLNKPKGSKKAAEESEKKKVEIEEADANKNKKDNEHTCNDPINVVTGSQKMVQTDMVVQDTVETFSLYRTYQSIHENKGGLLGSRWYLNVGSWLYVKENKATAILPDMHLERFTKKDDVWENDHNGDKSVWLEENRDGYCLMIMKERKAYHYSHEGQLSRITDRNGNSIWLRYAGKTLLEMAFPSGQSLKFRYTDSKISEIEDTIGRKTCYRYEGDLLTEVEYPNHGTVHYTYTPEGYLEQVTDQNGHTYVHNYYDMEGRVTRQTLSNGQEYIILYDDALRVNTFLTPSNGSRREYHYNKDELLIKTVFTDGSTEVLGYDQYRNKNYVKDRMGGELHSQFDIYGNLLREELPNGLVTEFAYDSENNLIRQWDNADRDQEMTYDSHGNQIQIRTLIEGDRWKTTKYAYDRSGRIIAVEDAEGNRVQFTYKDNEGGMASVTTAEGNTIRFTYDGAGRCMSVTDGLGRTEYAYNQMDHITREVDPLGNTTKYFYDMLCNITKVVLPNQYDDKTRDGAGTRYLYDAMDEVIQWTDPLGNVYATPRDLEENVIKEINPNCYNEKTKDGEGICYEYDTEDRRIRIHYPDGGIERIQYDANGNIIQKIQPEQYNKATDDGAGYVYDYDCVNRLVQITAPDGIVVKRYVYDAHGNITKEIDGEGYISADNDKDRIGILYQYNAIGWLTEKREPVKQEEGETLYRLTRYSYDCVGNMTKEMRYRDFQTEKSAEGAIHVLSFGYDKDNRRIQVSDNTGASVQYQYNCKNQCTHEERKLSDTQTQTIVYEYDKAGRLIKEAVSTRENDGRIEYAITRYVYDKTGNCTNIRLPEGGEILREYNAADRLIAETHIDKKGGIHNRTGFTYDKAGNLICITDNQGNKIQIEYDLLNRETRTIERDGGVTRQLYGLNGNVIKRIHPNEYHKNQENGAGYLYIYDLQGRVSKIIGPDGNILQKNIYDRVGRLLRQTDSMDSGMEYTYNYAGDSVYFRTTGGATQELVYDAQGNITGVIDGNQNHTHYELDDWGRIAGITKPDGSTESYLYDHTGNITSATDGEGNTTQYTYDLSGNMICITDPTGEKEQYLYDKEGHVIEKTDRNDITTQFAFNMYGAPLYRRVKNGILEESYQYTPEGLMKAAISSGMHYSYEYNKMGRIAKKSASGRTLLTYNYDLNGNLIHQKDVTGKVTEYTYNALDLIEKVTDNGIIIAEYSYYPDGTTRSLKNGNLYTEYTFDADKNLTGLKTHLGTEVLTDNHYTYDRNGNRTEKRQLNGSTHYTYDGRNQLTKVQYPTYTEELYYDKTGNRTRRTAKGIEELYKYDPRNRLTEYTKGGVTTQFTYDNAGNLLRDDKAKYTYDAFNRTEKVETFDGHVQINRYDAEGLRHELEEDGKLVQFIFRGDEIVGEEKDSNIIRYIRGYDLVASDAESARTYYHYASDEMGSITHVVEKDQVQNHYEYDTWGNTITCEEIIENRFRFNGQQYDPITQQYYLRARFYNPVIGRFTQEDTYRGDGLNLYAYCANNPVYYVDPSGNMPKCVKDTYDKYKAQGLTDEDAYRRAYLKHAQDKLNPKKNKQYNQLSPKEKYKLEQRRARIIYSEAERVTGLSRNEIAAKANITDNSQLQVLAIYQQGDVIQMSVNPKARKSNGTISKSISVSARSPKGKEIKLPKIREQNTTSGAHAEVNAMYIVGSKGVQGGNASLTVIGCAVCSDCANTSIRTMADALKVDTLTVNDYMANGQYEFHNGDEFFNKKQGGIAWSKGKIGDYNP